MRIAEEMDRLVVGSIPDQLAERSQVLGDVRVDSDRNALFMEDDHIDAVLLQLLDQHRGQGGLTRTVDPLQG